MKKAKYLLFVMVAIFSLTGCGKLKADKRLEKAINKLSKEKNLTAIIKLDMAMDANDQEMDLKVKATAKVDTEKNNFYLDAKVNGEINDFDLDYDGEIYLVNSKKKTGIYFTISNLMTDWYKLEMDSSAANPNVYFNVNDGEKVDMSNFSDIEVVETEDGVTKISAFVKADEVKDRTQSLVPSESLNVDKVKLFFYIDKKNNLTKIELDSKYLMKKVDFGDANVKNIEFSISFDDFGKTEITVPKKVANNAKELNENELMSLVSMFSSGFGGDDIFELNSDVDGDLKYSDSYDAEDIFYDILLSGSVSNAGTKVDFKNYNDELILDDDEYDIKRVTQGVIEFNDDEFTIIEDVIIDGKTCKSLDGTRLDLKCE